jgi:small subunit ribosomal protein S9
MASSQPSHLWIPFRSICRQCRQRANPLPPAALLQRHQQQQQQRKPFSTSSPHRDELEEYAESTSTTPSDDNPFSAGPARIIPASPSYFTASPQFNDDILLLRALLREYESLPTIDTNRPGPSPWLKLATYRTNLGEPVSSSKYSKVLQLLARLNRIHPNLQSVKLKRAIDRFRRPGLVAVKKAPPGKLDEEGRAYGLGRRKTSAATVHLVEGSGEVLVNGRNLVDAFPRLHDRESALWALKVTGRMDKYNVFALTSGGGVTGQAESITLALGRALMVHEPALKPTLRRGEQFLDYPFLLFV